MISLNEIDHFAAEYVIGTLDHDERVEVTVMRASNKAMDAAVTAWEKRLAPLNERMVGIVPSDNLFARIEQRIMGHTKATPLRPARRKGMYKWQGVALAAAILLVIIVSGNYIRNNAPIEAPQLVATLQTDTAKPMFIISLNQKTGAINVHTSTDMAPPDKSYELWIIPAGEKTPLAVGILPDTDSKLPSIVGLDPTLIPDATLAVSVEPLGGSPSGAPTGPVIVTGKFKHTSL